MKRSFVRDLLVVHGVVAVAVGLGWWALAPSLAYVVVDGTPFPIDQRVTTRVFDGDAVLVLLGVAAGLVCAGVVLGRGHRGARVPVGLALAGAVGSAAGWALAVLLGPGRVDTLAAAAGDGEVVAGPELGAYATLLVWPITALVLTIVVVTLSAPEPTRRRSPPA